MRRAAFRAAYFETRSFDSDPEAAMAYLNAVASLYASRLVDFGRRWPNLPAGWTRAATMSDFPKRLTPAEAESMIAEIDAVIARYRGDEADAPADAVPVAVQLLAFAHGLVLWQLYIAAGLFGAVDAFFEPALSSMLPTIVEPDAFEGANGLLSAASAWRADHMFVTLPSCAPHTRPGHDPARAFRRIPFAQVVKRSEKGDPH